MGIVQCYQCQNLISIQTSKNASEVEDICTYVVFVCQPVSPQGSTQQNHNYVKYGEIQHRITSS